MKNFKNILSNPSRESQPWALWIWNLQISRIELEKQLNALISKGFGGIAIRPGRNMTPAYLSEEFLEHFGYVLEVAQQNGVGVRLADDLSLSWSGALEPILNQKRNFRADYLVLDQQISPGEKGECEAVLEPHEEYIAQAVKFKGKTVLMKETKQVTVPSSKSVLHWNAPGSDWKLLLFKKEQVRDFSGGYIPNVMNQKIAQAYIQNTLEVLKNKFSKYIPNTFEGFITEMPNLRPGAGGIPWDDDLVVKYRAKYKKDLVKLLPALFFETDPLPGKTRVQIYSFMFNFMCERFASVLDGWAKKHRLSQWVLWGERGMYRPEDSLVDGFVPGDSVSSFGLQNVDGTLDSYALLRTVSDINTNEHRRETVTVIGRNRIGLGNTIQSFKREMDLSLMSGNSRIIIDGFFFNIDQRSYYKTPCNPAWYSPEWEHMKSLCDYSSRTQQLINELHSVREVAVLSPAAFIMAQYLPGESDAVSMGQTQLQKTLETLARLDLGYDMVTEELLLSCTLRQNGEFGTSDRIRKGSYQALVVPFAPFVSRSMLVFLEKMISKGTTVVFIDEPIQGTYEDGASNAVTARVQKLVSGKKENVHISSASELEQALSVVNKEVSVLKESGIPADVAASIAYGEGYKLYLFQNISDSTEQAVSIELPYDNYFAVIDCANGEVHEIENVEQKENTAKLKFCFSPLQTVMIASSSVKIAEVSNADRPARHVLNTFTLPQRNYRIVFKDQWSFEPRSMNVLPLANWNIRIGLSRESGHFSHFYETTFDVRSIPDHCMFLLSGFGHPASGDPSPDREVTVNGSRVRTDFYSDGTLEQECAPFSEEKSEKITESKIDDQTLQKLFGEKVSYYDIRRKTVKGLNRISIRTTGSITDPQPLLYPPLVMGTFSISKGPNGWCLDKPSGVVGHDSWTKYGYPYLSGRAVYSQSFEIPSEYKKLILRFSQVSGAVFVKINGNALGSFQWHPMEIDITPFCSAKRNDLSIEVVNTVDNVLRMNGRPSGLTGEVFIDVY
ncbi:MAG: hypothetical protein ACLFVE_11685 [Chitinispirillaceae bacterium]